MAFTLNLPLGKIEVVYSRFIVVTAHQDCIYTPPEQGCKPWTNDCESNNLAIRLSGSLTTVTHEPPLIMVEYFWGSNFRELFVFPLSSVLLVCWCRRMHHMILPYIHHSFHWHKLSYQMTLLVFPWLQTHGSTWTCEMYYYASFLVTVLTWTRRVLLFWSVNVLIYWFLWVTCFLLLPKLFAFSPNPRIRSIISATSKW